MADLKAILFDLDDTLLDWSGFDGDYGKLERKHLGGVHRYLTGQGHSFNLEHLLDRFQDGAFSGWEEGRKSLNAPHLVRIVMKALHDVGLVNAKLDEDVIMEHYNWGAVEGTRIFDEVPATLQMFRDAGLKLGIVTNAFQPMKLRDIEITQHGIIEHFPDCRFSAADVGHLKPHPTIFKTALDCIGTEPAETVFVGDNLNADIVGAQRVGMKGIWRDTGHHDSRFSLGEIVPDATIKKLDEMPAILDKWYPGWR